MKLFELLQCEHNEDVLEEITVYVPESLLSQGVLALESLWKPSGYKDWYYRVDPARPEMKQTRHVHIARERHKSTKTKQASWDEQGRRHDKKAFDTRVGENSYVQDLARRVLGIPSSVALEDFELSMVTVTGNVFLLEDGREGCVVFDIPSR